ncbi:MAG TPA: methyltransferase domain-containing protein [Candidatus Limnocylindrales bacterium]|nr:methyltransferase domain-containing protein [Candidatus Limnocylindrales bacterium]
MHALTYHPLEKLSVARPVERIDYIVERCAGRRVLDLGALDETLIGKPQHSSWKWLHREIARSAAEVLGVDAGEEVRKSGEIRTDAGTRIVYGKVEDLDALMRDFRPEVVVAGELIEHTPDTLGWLTRAAAAAPGARLIATTPNATSILNILLSFASRESQHEDHLHVYSYKTLTTLAARLRLENAALFPYYYHSEQFRGRVPKPVAPLISAIDYAILMPIQYLFPLTAFGFILDGTFPKS